jgi:hypothetical protein
MGPKNTGKREKGTMGTTILFKPAAIQKKALSLLKGGAKHILLFDGSRSGKTTVLVMAIIYRALRFAGSRGTKPWGDTCYRLEDMIPTSDWDTGSDTP